MNTSPIGAFKPNAWGLHDMSGNVWQWCGDRFGPYSDKDATDPQGPPTGDRRVLRGGSWDLTPSMVRSAFRIGDVPEAYGWHIGFRVVVEVATDTSN